MRTEIRRRLTLMVGLTILALGALALSPLGRGVLFHLSPIRWTDEPERLAALLHLQAGMVVADIGAGDGAMAVEIAKVAGSASRLYVTERTPEQRARLTERTGHLRDAVVIEALEDRTNLPDACCDAIYMRMVWHHLDDRPAYARSLARAIRPGGRLVIIDFSPGAFFHLAADHGVTAEAVIPDITAAGFTVERRDDRWGRAFAVSFVRSGASAPSQDQTVGALLVHPRP